MHEGKKTLLFSYLFCKPPGKKAPQPTLWTHKTYTTHTKETFGRQKRQTAQPIRSKKKSSSKAATDRRRGLPSSRPVSSINSNVTSAGPPNGGAPTSGGTLFQVRSSSLASAQESPHRQSLAASLAPFLFSSISEEFFVQMPPFFQKPFLIRSLATNVTVVTLPGLAPSFVLTTIIAFLDLAIRTEAAPLRSTAGLPSDAALRNM